MMTTRYRPDFASSVLDANDCRGHAARLVLQTVASAGAPVTLAWAGKRLRRSVKQVDKVFSALRKAGLLVKVGVAPTAGRPAGLYAIPQPEVLIGAGAIQPVPRL